MKIKAKKSLGQNFLKDKHFRLKIANNVKEFYKDYSSLPMIEIGPGHGDLTHEFIKLNKDIVLYEIDKDLIEGLNKQFPETKIINSDFMDEIPNIETSILVSNLPYYIGSRMIVDLIGYNKHFPFAFILQKEVAMKTKDSSDLTFFGAILNIFYDTKVEFIIPPNAFNPAPKVYSALLTGRPKTPKYDGTLAINILKAMFFKPNKTLSNNLKYGLMDPDLIAKIYETYKYDPNTRVNWDNYETIFDQIYTLGM
jgi:16S rRNA (adenine1518-N6/adenine1519-N6)-dimethyltransferase